MAPIFEGGRLRAQVDVATAQRDQAAFVYRGTGLTAFEEVETALSATQRLAEQFDRALKRREILLRSVALATDRYRGGCAYYLEQLGAQRNLYSTELDAISATGAAREYRFAVSRARWSVGRDRCAAPPLKPCALIVKPSRTKYEAKCSTSSSAASITHRQTRGLVSASMPL